MDGSPRAPSPVSDSDDYAQWDAAYVLGSLTDAARDDTKRICAAAPRVGRQSTGSSVYRRFWES